MYRLRGYGMKERWNLAVIAALIITSYDGGQSIPTIETIRMKSIGLNLWSEK